MGAVGNHIGRAERMRIVCDHYLDLERGLQEGSGNSAIWPCPSCRRASFSASFEEGVVGCTEEGCAVPSSMGLLELIVYLDEDLEVGDERGAGEKFGEILEVTVRGEQEREAESKERRRRAREERYWQRGLARARTEELFQAQKRLF